MSAAQKWSTPKSEDRFVVKEAPAERAPGQNVQRAPRQARVKAGVSFSLKDD